MRPSLKGCTVNNDGDDDEIEVSALSYKLTKTILFFSKHIVYIVYSIFLVY